MATLAKTIGRSLSAVLQVAGVLYLAAVFWLTAQWMAHDEWAASASPHDWWWAAAFRFGNGLFWAAVIGLSLWWVNRLLLRVELSFSGAWPRAIAFGSFALIATAAAIGAVQFVVEKPVM